jgi:hypothetical protein
VPTRALLSIEGFADLWGPCSPRPRLCIELTSPNQVKGTDTSYKGC